MKEASAWRGWAIWAVAAVCAAVLWWRHESNQHAIPAVVGAARHQLGAVEASRISAVYVNPGDTVRAGQPLVRFDCSETDTELGVARAQLQENLAEVEAVAVQFADEARRRRMEIETELGRVRATLADAKGLREAQEAELGMLTDQLARLDKVIRNRLTEVDRLTALRARQGRLVSQKRYAPEALSAWSEVAVQVREALESLDDGDISVRLSPLKARVETQNQRVQQLLERRTRCTLNAPVDGQVSDVLHLVGDAVTAGSAVVVVVSPQATSVTAYLPEDSADTLELGRLVEVRPRDRRPQQVARGVIDRVGPEIAEMPARLWLVPDRPQYGRPVHILVDAGSDLFPGELAYVQAETGRVQAAVLPPEQSFAARVPDVLRRRTRLDVSGLAWLPSRNRFLAVSDDTGLPQSDEHRPWVFTVDADGTFDADPLVISGVDEVSDLESVTRNPDGQIYLLASQSLSRKGRRPIKRQWLLRARLADEGLRLTGKLALYDDLLARLDVADRMELGVSDQLDVEGMAWHEGGLILGLKAPQDAAGRARLWYLADVDSLLASAGREPATVSLDGAEPPEVARLSPFGALSLPTCKVGAPGGISDLLLDGDRLYILSTLLEGEACGSAWRVDLPLGQNRPQKLADWSGLKPEGIARASNGELRISFDTGAAAPRFARLMEQ